VSLIDPRRRRRPPARPPGGAAPSCPFCRKTAERPARVAPVFSCEPRLGGRCGCGAAYVIDETGKAGGEALLDALAVACDGDLDRALALGSDGYRVEKRPYRGGANTVGLARVGSAYVTPSVWFIALRPPPA
jgi:hypothetical protein